jgi:hypothetical protein
MLKVLLVRLKTQAKIAKTKRTILGDKSKKQQNLLCMHNKFQNLIAIFETINLKYL